MTVGMPVRMTRFACLVAALLSLHGFVPRDAAARVMIRRPSVAQSCPGASTWDATQKCIQRFGKTKILRSQGGVRLVQLQAREDGFDTSGVYLYVQSNKRWRVGGAYFDLKPVLVGFSTPTFDHRRSFRIDFEYAANEGVMVDEVSARNALVRRKTSLFCSGESAGCTEILTACDAFVAGKLHATFRGTLKYEGGGVLRVTGDRSRSGDVCQQAEENFISVPSIDFDLM
jgi:hypothetical protein